MAPAQQFQLSSSASPVCSCSSSSKSGVRPLSKTSGMLASSATRSAALRSRSKRVSRLSWTSFFETMTIFTWYSPVKAFGKAFS